ncbi:hypothetical protein AAZX31_07G133300 [Glycine max]|nr:hypothetical protein GLYMA_07G141800v4 [Glycine max]KAH1086818.1 hypothetical protein GYH30_018374 [Glycine max]
MTEMPNEKLKGESFIFFFTQMNIVRLPIFCLNSTILKNMNICVAITTYFYLFLCCMFEFLSLSGSFLYYLKKMTFITMINFEVHE